MIDNIRLQFPCNFVGITTKYNASNHKAIDLGWNKNWGGPNHEILAPYDGEIVEIRSNYSTNDKTGSSYGNYVKIKHNESIYTLSAHLVKGSVKVKVGDKVVKGQVVGKMGNTGHSNGTHCHFEVFVNGKKVNPLIYTYLYSNQHATDDTLKIIKVITEEPTTEDKEIKELQLKIDDLTSENKELKSELEQLKKYKFQYVVPKTKYYKIKLNEKEIILIKEMAE